MPDLSPLERWQRDYVTRFIVCDRDGTEIAEIPDEMVERFAELCSQDGRGFYVKQTHALRTMYG